MMFVYILWLPELILYDQDPPHRTASSAKTRVRMKKLVKIHHKYSYLGSVPKNMIFTKPHFKPLKLFLFLHHSSSSSGVLYIAAAKNFRLAFVRRSRHLETKVEKSSAGTENGSSHLHTLERSWALIGPAANFHNEPQYCAPLR